MQKTPALQDMLEKMPAAGPAHLDMILKGLIWYGFVKRSSRSESLISKYQEKPDYISNGLQVYSQGTNQV